VKNFTEFLHLISQHDVTAYEVMNASNSKDAQKSFLSYNAKEPNFEYNGPKNLPIETLRSNLQSLEQIANNIERDHTLTPIESQLLKITLKHACDENQLAIAAYDYRHSVYMSEANLAAMRFRLSNLELFGDKAQADGIAIDYDVFLAMVKWYMQRIPADALRTSGRVLYDKLTERLSSIGWEDASSDAIFQPQPHVMQQFGELVEKYFANIFSHIPDNEIFSPQEVCNLINEILNTEFKGETKFQAQLDTTRRAIYVDQKDRIIYIPLQRSLGPYTHKTVKNIVIGHELCTHAYRGIPYEMSNITPLAEGVVGYGNFDEGLAKCVEQSLAKTYVPSGFSHYINLALIEYENLTFREAYDVCFALEFLSGTKVEETEEEYQKRFQATQSLAFERIRRATRGTNRLPLFKDLAYYNGNIIVWQYIEAHLDQPEQLMINLFESGKTDITNPMHYELVQMFKHNSSN